MLPITLFITYTHMEDLHEAIRKAVQVPSLNHIIIAPYRDTPLDWEAELRLIDESRRWAAREHLSVALHAGAVVPMTKALELLQPGSTACCLAASPYVLLAMDGESQGTASDIFYQLMLNGFQPILSTPEQVLPGMHGASRLLHWMQKGVLSLSDLDSLSGLYGRSAWRQVRLLLHNHLICFWGIRAENVAGNYDLSRQIQKIFHAAGPDYGQDTLCRYPQGLREHTVFYPSLPSRVAPINKSLFSWFHH